MSELWCDLLAEVYAATGRNADGDVGYAVPSSGARYPVEAQLDGEGVVLGLRVDDTEAGLPGGELNAELDLGVVLQTLAARAANRAVRVDVRAADGAVRLTACGRVDPRSGIAREVLLGRRSQRDLTGDPVDIPAIRTRASQLAQLLVAPDPQPVGIDIVTTRRDQWPKILNGQRWVADAAALVVVESGGELLRRSAARYCGAVAMAWHLAAYESGIGSCIVGSLDAAELDSVSAPRFPANVRLVVTLGAVVQQ